MPHCPRLGGHCTRTGDHQDHRGPDHALLLPTADGPVEASARLEQWAGAEPAVALYLGSQALDLSPRHALRAATALAVIAVRLLRLAVQLRTTR